VTFSTDNFDSVPGIITYYCGRVSILANLLRAILNLLGGSMSRTMTLPEMNWSSASNLVRVFLMTWS